MTIMPVALPIEHIAAEWYTRVGGISPAVSNFSQENGALSTFKHHTSLTGSVPVFPPKTNKYGLLNTIVWPYLRPGV